MEVGSRDKPTPRDSLIKLLLQQVEEQSEMCDITVKVGQWEKKFHRCVLSASPFFESAINGLFLEKQRGIVEISSGSSKCVEMALLFLYGEEPYITIDIVEDLLEKAEFLLIKSLKSLCIRWLCNLHITQENCMHLLQLSSLFGLEVTGCIEYIESHLSQVLSEKGAIHLSKDSIQYLFSDPRFSYVTMDERLRFLVQWFNKHPEERTQNVKDLFNTIYLSQVSQSVWDDTKLVSSFSKAVDLRNVVRVPEDENASRAIWIMSGTNTLFWCLDFKKKQWYRRNSYLFQGFISGIKQIYNGRSEIYFVDKFIVDTLDLETNGIKTYELFSRYGPRKNFKNINVSRKTVLASVKVTKNIVIDRKYQIRFITTSVLYRGHLSKERVIMKPILSLRDEEISKMCIGNSTVALLQKSKQAVIIFDFTDYQLEKHYLALKEGDKIVRYKDGFLIFNCKRCHCLSRLRGPSLSKKYLLEEIELGKEKMLHSRYIFSRGMWLRLVRKHITGDLKLQYVFHQTLIASKSSRGVNWKDLSMPQQNEGFVQQLMQANLFLVRLPRNQLRCHIVCPHCDLLENENLERMYENKSDESDFNTDYSTDCDTDYDTNSDQW